MMREVILHCVMFTWRMLQHVTKLKRLEARSSSGTLTGRCQRNLQKTWDISKTKNIKNISKTKNISCTQWHAIIQKVACSQGKGYGPSYLVLDADPTRLIESEAKTVDIGTGRYLRASRDRLSSRYQLISTPTYLLLILLRPAYSCSYSDLPTPTPTPTNLLLLLLRPT